MKAIYQVFLQIEELQDSLDDLFYELKEISQMDYEKSINQINELCAQLDKYHN